MCRSCVGIIYINECIDFTMAERNADCHLAAPGGSSGRVDVGSISIQELVARIRSGSGSVEMQTGNGMVSLDTCIAVMELLEMYLDPATLEMLRKAWRESVINKTDKHEKAGLPRYGGLVNGDKIGERKRSG